MHQLPRRSRGQRNRRDHGNQRLGKCCCLRTHHQFTASQQCATTGAENRRENPCCGNIPLIKKKPHNNAQRKNHEPTFVIRAELRHCFSVKAWRCLCLKLCASNPSTLKYMTEFKDMLLPPPVLLPEDPNTNALTHPESPLAWAILAEQALEGASTNSTTDQEKLQAYAFARTGYHRGLDRLRAHGWKGFGPVPWSHEPNHGVLRAIAALALAAQLIGEDSEYERCRALLTDADSSCVEVLLP